MWDFGRCRRERLGQKPGQQHPYGGLRVLLLELRVAAGARAAAVDADDIRALLALQALDALGKALLPELVWKEQTPFARRAINGNRHDPNCVFSGQARTNPDR